MRARDLGATGRDPTGAVTLVVDADGLAVSITLHPDWRRLVGAHGLAPAVSQAGRDAVESRRDIDEAGPYGWEGEHAAWEAEQAARQRTDDIGSIAERIWRAFDVTERLTQRLREGADTGTSGLGRLSLTFDPSDALVCQADAEWVGQQDTAQLEATLASALESLRSRRDTTEALWAQARATVAWLAADPGPRSDDRSGRSLDGD